MFLTLREPFQKVLRLFPVSLVYIRAYSRWVLECYQLFSLKKLLRTTLTSLSFTDIQLSDETSYCTSMAGADVWSIEHVLAISATMTSTIALFSHPSIFRADWSFWTTSQNESLQNESLFIFLRLYFFVSTPPVLIISADFALSKQNKAMYASVITCHPVISYHSVSRVRFWTNKEVGLIFRDQETTFIIDMSAKISFRSSFFPTLKQTDIIIQLTERMERKKATLDSLKKRKSTVITAELFLTDGTLAVFVLQIQHKTCICRN